MNMTGFVRDLAISIVCTLPMFLYCALFMMIAG